MCTKLKNIDFLFTKLVNVIILYLLNLVCTDSCDNYNKVIINIVNILYTLCSYAKRKFTYSHIVGKKWPRLEMCILLFTFSNFDLKRMKINNKLQEIYMIGLYVNILMFKR